MYAFAFGSSESRLSIEARLDFLDVEVGLLGEDGKPLLLVSDEELGAKYTALLVVLGSL